MIIKTKSLIPGFKTNEEIILDNSVGYKIDANHILTERDLVRLTERGIEKIDVEISNEYETFNKSFNNLVDDAIKSIDINRYKDVSELYKYIVSTSKLLKYNIANYFDKEYQNHIVNTINISIILANSYNHINEENNIIDLADMALASMLVDIGRTCKDEYILKRVKSKYQKEYMDLVSKYPKIPRTLLDKYDSKYHPVYSYLLSKNYNLSDDMLSAILFHHEKQKGNSLLGVELSYQNQNNKGIIMAEIIKLADLFDVLLISNVNENPKKPFASLNDQIDKIVNSGFVNEKLTDILKKVIPLYQIGTKVDLSDGTVGIVSSNEPKDYTKPIITDFNGVYVDLDKEKIEINRHHID